MNLKIGPSGIGSVVKVEKTFELFNALGIKAAEIPFTYGVFVKTKEDAEKIKKASEKFNISLSIHAPYWINLNSLEKEKVEKSKQRILECCKIGELIGVKKVVFHAGFYGEDSIEKTYEEIKKIILELLETISENKWKIKIAPEIMGKKNVFGSIDEINKLVVETGCDFCIDFAHVLARYGNYNFEEIKEKFGKFKNWHLHFSGIEYGEKGERKHLETEESQIKKLLENLPQDKEITIINEAPNPLEDAVKIIKIAQEKNLLSV